MSMLKQAISAVLLVMPASGKPVWTPSDAKFDRRLGIDTVTSTTNTSDAGCVVGAYNTEMPTHIYVGGPCSELGSNNEPTANFRWVEMFTFHADIEDTQGNTASLEPDGGVVHAEVKATHAEVSVGGYMKFQDADISKARLFASTTSYLAKSTFSFNTNDFVTEEKPDGSFDTVTDVCVEKCCAAACTCDNGCPTTKTTANAGDYKYSLFAAAYDDEGASGNGWAKAIEKYGEGSPKQLKGHYNVYQAVDFTNMKADVLTVTAPDGSATIYSAMSDCSLDKLANCTAYPVKSVEVEDDSGFSAQYEFPMTYNRGSWSWSETAKKVETKPSDTKTVAISMVRPDAAWLEALGMTGKKVVFLEYKFDISGVTGAQTSGSWMAYDPTVRRAAKISASNNPSTTSPGTSTADAAYKSATVNGLLLAAAAAGGITLAAM